LGGSLHVASPWRNLIVTHLAVRGMDAEFLETVKMAL
jgi:hypothetical protein